jgi:predicted nucleic acid-binding protein
MNKYLLDTSVIIEYLRGKSGWVEKIDKLEGEINSSFICLAELYEGINREVGRKSEGKVLSLFKSCSEVFGLDVSIAETFGRVRAELRKKGKVIEDLDLLIAATSLSNNQIMVTTNRKHFEKVLGLRILD